MRQIRITDNDYQRVTFVSDINVVFEIKFLAQVEMWTVDIEYEDRKINGIKLSVGTLHLLQYGVPFDILVVDTSNKGVDPVLQDDFSNGRCVFIVVEKDDVEAIRGQKIEV